MNFSDLPQIIKKLEFYCSYSERSEYEVKQKMQLLKVPKIYYTNILSHLEEQNFLNERRYAISYVSAKYRLKRWGKIKIKQGLQAKLINNKVINEAINTIENDLYIKNLNYLLHLKMQELNKSDCTEVIKKQKLLNYLLQKGYEKELIFNNL